MQGRYGPFVLVPERKHVKKRPGIPELGIVSREGVIADAKMPRFRTYLEQLHQPFGCPVSLRPRHALRLPWEIARIVLSVHTRLANGGRSRFGTGMKDNSNVAPVQ